MIDSISLARNRSTITSHSASLLIWPLRIRTSLASIQQTMEIDEDTLLLQGITMSTNWSGASVLQRAMHGMLTYEASTTAWWSHLGSVTISSLGSSNFPVFWLVSFPGIHLDEDTALALVQCPNLQTALCPSAFEQTTITSLRLEMEAITLAASLILLQVSFRLKMQFPALFFFSTYLVMEWVMPSAPKCT